MGRVWGWLVFGWIAAAGAAPTPSLWTEAKQRQVRAERSAIAEVARRALPAVVSITTRTPPEAGDDEEPQKGLGAGFFIHPDGYLLTASHVIEDATEIKVSLQSTRGVPEELDAQVIGKDPQTDIALLKVDGERKFPVLELSTSRSVEIADWVVVIGNPFGLSHSVTVGVVSFKGRTDVVPSGRSGFFDYLQTDAPINPGNSGGPILDLHGEVVAIANAVNVAGQGIGFATPIDVAKAVLPQLRAHGKFRRGWMGVMVEDLTPEVAKSHRQRSYSGVLVTDVRGGSPADAAGMKAGDVIVSLDGETMERAHALRWRVATSTVGQQVALTVRREGKPVELSLRLGETPFQQAPSPAPDEPLALALGASVSTVDRTASLRCGLAEPMGALVRSVVPGGPLQKAGLAEGDVVLKVNTTEISNPAQLHAVLQSLPGGSLVRLYARRGTSTLTFSLRKPQAPE
ncbi:MAG: trypsin-like peptidase domain-containing protein [Myxococcota bacterium]